MHEGDGEDVQNSTLAVERSLRAGLPATDHRIIGARLETAEMYAALAEGQHGGDFPLMPYRRAMQVYGEAADLARGINRPDLVALADLRRAILAHRLGLAGAREQLEAVAALTSRETRVQQLAARIFLAGIARQAGDTAATDRLIRDLAAAGLRTPTLLHAPPIAMPGSPGTGGTMLGGDVVAVTDPIRNASSEGFDYWADVGFWINADGRVEEVEVLRSHGPQYWLQPVLTSVQGRIYSPPGSGELSFRVERYRYTSLLERRTGTRLLGHSAQGRIERLDITHSAQGNSGGGASPPPQERQPGT